MACVKCDELVANLKSAIADRDTVIGALLAEAGHQRAVVVDASQPKCAFCGARVPSEAIQVWLEPSVYPKVAPVAAYYRICRRCDVLLTEFNPPGSWRGEA